MAMTVAGLDEVIASLEAMNARIANLAPVLELIASDTVGVIDDAFETGVSPGGMTWAALLPSTVAKRRNNSSKPLNDTSRLRTSANARAEGNRLRFGTSASYGIFHQSGTRQIVPRPFLPVEGDPGMFVLGSSGAAGVHWARARASIRDYVVTGRIG
jgi:phage gpG-like protein